MATTAFRAPSLGRRAAGSFIDGVIFAVPSLVAWALGYRLNTWLYAGLLAIYTITLTAASGQTLGKQLVRIRVVVDDATSVAPPPVASCIVRWAILSVPALLPDPFGGVLGFIVLAVAVYGIASDERARGIHDHLADTRVIEAF